MFSRATVKFQTHSVEEHILKECISVDGNSSTCVDKMNQDILHKLLGEENLQKLLTQDEDEDFQWGLSYESSCSGRKHDAQSSRGEETGMYKQVLDNRSCLFVPA
jgi:hypothetical protein